MSVVRDSDDRRVSAVDAPAMTNRLQGIPFVRAVGMSAIRAGARSALTTVPRRAAASFRGGDDAFCEGVVAAVADQAGSAGIWAEFGLELPHATITLSMMFLRPARSAALHFDGQVVGVHGGVGHTAVTAREPDGRVVAQALVDYALGSYPGASGPSTTRPVADASQVDGVRIADLAGDHVEDALGLVDEDCGVQRLPFAANLLGSRDPLALHGGVIAAASVACAKGQRPAGGGFRLSHLTVDYLRSGLPQETRFRPRVVSMTRKTLLVEVDAFQDDGRRHVATSSARFYAG